MLSKKDEEVEEEEEKIKTSRVIVVFSQSYNEKYCNVG